MGLEWGFNPQSYSRLERGRMANEGSVAPPERINIKYRLCFFVKTSKIKHPKILSSKLQDVIDTLIIYFIKAQATPHNKVKIFTDISMLKRELFFQEQVWVKLRLHQLFLGLIQWDEFTEIIK